MLITFEQVLILLVFALAGYILSKCGLANPDHTKILSTLLVYVFLPCISFKTFATRFTVAYLGEKYPLILVSLGVLAVIMVMARVLSRVLVKDEYQQRIYEYTLIVPNISYIGYALAEGIYGEAVLMDMMMFTLPMSVYISTVAYANLTTKGGQKVSWKRAFSPSTVAILLGAVVGLSGLELPNLMLQVVTKSAACMGPVSMLLTGIVISQFRIRDMVLAPKTYLICALRLLVIPTVVFLLLKLVGLELAITSAVLTYCMPCGANTIIFARLAGQDCKTGASFAMVSILLSLLTVPLCLYIFL